MSFLYQGLIPHTTPRLLPASRSRKLTPKRFDSVTFHDRTSERRLSVAMSRPHAGGPVVPRQDAADPFGLLLRERIVFLGNQVDDFTADAVISQLLLLDAQDPKKVRCFTFYKLYRCFRRSVFQLKTN